MTTCNSIDVPVNSSNDKESAGSERSLSMARRRLQRGSLYKKQSGGLWGWRVKYMLRFHVPGEKDKIVRKDEFVGTLEKFPTKKLAQRAVDEKLAELNSTSYQPNYLVSFGTIATKWEKMVLPQHKLHTQNTMRSQLTKIRAGLGQLMLGDLNREAIQLWISEQSAEYSPKTVRNLLGTVRLVWQSAQDWGYIPEDKRSPFERLRLPKKELSQAPCFTVEQAKDIIRKAEEPYRTMFWILAETGMRGGEVCGLYTEDVDFTNLCIRVKRSAALGTLQTPKTSNAIRTCPISPVLAEHLQRFVQKPVRSSHTGKRIAMDEIPPVLFANHRGEPLDNKSIVRYVLKPLLEQIDMAGDRYGLHAFRHANISAMGSLRVPDKVLQERVGHGQIQTSRGYMHAYSSDHRETAAKLGEVFNPTFGLPEPSILGGTPETEPNASYISNTENVQPEYAQAVGAD